MGFGQHQRWIMAQAAAATGLLLLAWTLQENILHNVPLPNDTLEDRLRLVAYWLVLPGLTLLAGVLAMASGRFFGGGIDGSRNPANPWLEINLRYNLNTLEQVVLAGIAWFGLAIGLPHEKLNLIPLLAILFALGRFTFWLGYLIQPVARAFGLLITFVPTCASYLWLLSRMAGS